MRYLVLVFKFFFIISVLLPLNGTVRGASTADQIEEALALIPQKAPYFICGHGEDNPQRAPFSLLKAIGQGSFGLIVLARATEHLSEHLSAGDLPELFAIKWTDCRRQTRRGTLRSLWEIGLLENITSFFIPRIYWKFNSLGGIFPAAFDQARSRDTPAESSADSREQALPDYVAFAMDYAPGGDLRRAIKRRSVTNNFFREPEAAKIFTQLLFALHRLHHDNILHRDIKSENIFFYGKDWVKLGDFGFARQYTSSVEEPVDQFVCGTAPYLSPEAWQKLPYSKKADLYSLGIVFYELLAFKRPYGNHDNPDYRVSIELLKQRTLRAQYEALPQIRYPINDQGLAIPEKMSETLRHIVHRLISFDPDQRPDTAALLNQPYFRFVTSLVLELASKEDPYTRQRIFAEIVPTLRSLRLARARESTCAPRDFLELPHGSEIFSSKLLKEKEDGTWQNTFLMLWKNGEGALELVNAEEEVTVHEVISACCGKVERNPLCLFDDVVAVEEKFFATPQTNALALLKDSNGKRISFAAESPELRESWLQHLEQGLGSRCLITLN